jgi:hypothetical protein
MSDRILRISCGCCNSANWAVLALSARRRAETRGTPAHLHRHVEYHQWASFAAVHESGFGPLFANRMSALMASLDGIADAVFDAPAFEHGSRKRYMTHLGQDRQPGSALKRFLDVNQITDVTPRARQTPPLMFRHGFH